jgi:pimeloyl-ACP methyl ester carboxylesterase
MTRRAALWVLFAAGTVVGVALLAIDNRMWDEGGPGIVGFELAATEDHVDRILAEWGDEGRDAARLSLWLDFLFLALYSAFWALAVRALGSRRAWLLAPLAGAFDFLENVCLLVVLAGGGGGALPLLAALCATLKFIALALAVGYVVVALIRRFPKTAVLAVGVTLVVAPLVAYEIAGDAEPAEPDIGRLLPTQRGDIQVRVDGPPDGPPLVLIHGFAVSMRWWDSVVPTLARDFRVVRVDLLGHGGSEKPTEGYAMEEQAETVTEVMRLLRIERAPVVGHSMGGIVGTAMVERFPRFVSRLMMIGTPPDDEGLEGGLLANAAFLPVIGPLNHRFAGERLVRWIVESGFVAEFDPPRRLARDIFERTTWSSFDGSSDALADYWDDGALHERLADEEVPVTVLLGQEEEHTERSVRLYNRIPRARTVVMAGLDHSPQVESPARTAPLIAAFAR